MSITIDLSDQVALVTGGTRGIGQAIVRQMLEAGARVAFCAPEADECAARAAEFASLPGMSDRVMGMAANLRDRASLAALVKAVGARWGHIDSLICNAAEFGVPSRVEDVDPDIYMRLLQSNVVGNFHLCQQVVPGMLERGAGSITIVTSIVGYTTMPTNIPYSSSKAALASMARSLAAAYAGQGIRVNCVSPGLFRTEASRDIWDDPSLLEDYVTRLVPMLRIAEPSELAGACVFLASPMASYITAATLAVDGGRLGIGLQAGSARQIGKPRPV
ncbi:SDR family NAD(P)-dependent oxidoreductase [Paracoccus pantotrophus]|uniref:SDR family NAD(P)-dependent oxidoreductase n=1 Tax=Paracoccus pantotrophus TaxID=82367 RepID=UPI0004B4EE43|nr:SDR family oxidoreductase [Paracoccus pantotrophus]